MVCSKCGKDVTGEKCIFCGTLLQKNESDEQQKISKKNNVFKYKGIMKNMKLNKNGVLLFKGRHEGKDSDVYIPFKNIVQIKFVKAQFFKNGFITFCTRTGAGNDVNSARKAASDRQSITFRTSKNEEVAAFIDSFNTYLKKINPPYNGVLIEEDIGQQHELKKGLKQQLVQYEKEGIIYCPKCYGTNINYFKKNDDGINTKAKCRDCGHDWRIAKKDIINKTKKSAE